MILIWTDSHFDDNPSNEYRWKIFEVICKIAKQKNVSAIYHLGDFVDKKDRFSGAFVNRLVYEMRAMSTIAPLTILRGNHDLPLNGPAFFEFLNDIREPITYVVDPILKPDHLLLPFSHSPVDEWSGISLKDFKAAFMHQTPSGAVSENGISLDGIRLPLFPRGMKVYTGDAHVQQKVKNIVCVGCPYPIKFGDVFPCRILLLDSNSFEIVEEIVPDIHFQKKVLRISSLEDLKTAKLNPDDQVRIEFAVSSDQIEKWGETEQAIATWAKQSGVSIASIEAIVEQNQSTISDLEESPKELLRQFANDEKINKELLDVGFALLEG
jgi:Calcineurin-like phosphoesterase